MPLRRFGSCPGGSSGLAAPCRFGAAAGARTPPRSTAARGRGPGRTSSTRRRRPPRSSPTRASGRRSRSSSPARPRTAAASTSTRTTSTTTTARRRAPDPADPRTRGDTFSKPNGTYTLPDRPAPTRSNAADLVELRVQAARRRDGVPRHAQHAEGPVAGRLHDRDRRLARRAAAVPAGANVSAPADLFLTVHGTTRRPRRRGRPAGRVGPAPSVTVDSAAARSRCASRTRAWDPTARRVRLAAGVGLWDKADGQVPASPARPPTRPIPAARARPSSPPAFFNVAFRFDEPMPKVGDAAGTRRARRGGATKAQGDALRGRRHLRRSTPTSTSASSRGDTTTRRRAACRKRADGPHPRQPLRDRAGGRLRRSCFTGDRPARASCQGSLQPYAIYVPQQADAHARLRDDAAAALARRRLQPVPGQPQPVAVRRARRGLDRDHAVGRGPDGWLRQPRRRRHVRGLGRRRAPLQARPATGPSITGYSMGGIGTFKLAEQFPDLFAAHAQPTGRVWAPRPSREATSEHEPALAVATSRC